MRYFRTGTTTFFFLKEGQRLKWSEVYEAGEAYAIWPRGDKWDARFYSWDSKGWKKISNQLFDTDGEAFRFAHEHYLKRQDKMHAS